MTPYSQATQTKKHISLRLFLVMLIVIVLSGSIGYWLITRNPFHHQPQASTQRVGKTGLPPAPSGPVSPLVFGANMSLFDSHDQVLQSKTSRALLQQMHIRIVRMPVRTSLSDATETSAARIIKSLGAIPVVVLHGTTSPNSLADNMHLVSLMNNVFGKAVVYYEYGNEEDLQGVPVNRYIAAWNNAIPQLKHVALNGHFVGPVSYQYDHDYLKNFLQHAQPLPDEISWHEYTCDVSWEAGRCISNIDSWSYHISDARALMWSTVGSTLPIMITEWNYAPNAGIEDSKLKDNQFMRTWTNKALQTLAANRVFASMQYSMTNTAAPLINSNNTLTVQGEAFQAQYQQIITDKQEPKPIAVTNQATSKGEATSSPGNAKAGPIVFSFEDNTVSNWQGNGQGLTHVQNSSNVALDGTHSLQLSLQNLTPGDYPYITTNVSTLNTRPQPGHTLSASVYLASNSVTLLSKLFVMDGRNEWHAGSMVMLTPGIWTNLTFTIPSTVKTGVTSIGLQFNDPHGDSAPSNVYIDAVRWN
jgi:Mannanase, galactose-binding domain-like